VVVQSDGVEYLAPVEDRWGEIAQYPDLIDEYADRMIAMVRRAWADHQNFHHVIGTSICLSCLLEGGRYDEIQELLATRRLKLWPWHRFGAEALVRQGLWEAAIAYAEAARSSTNPGEHRLDDRSVVDRLLWAIIVGRSSDTHQPASFGDGDAAGPVMTDVVPLLGRGAFLRAPFRNSSSRACLPTSRSSAAIWASYSWIRSAA
jgi:hypothetical protein